MDSSICFRSNRLGTVHCIYLGVSGYNFKKMLCVFCLKILLTFTNNVDPDEMSIMQHFIWVFTVCKRTCLGVSDYKGLK